MRAVQRLLKIIGFARLRAFFSRRVLGESSWERAVDTDIKGIYSVDIRRLSAGDVLTLGFPEEVSARIRVIRPWKRIATVSWYRGNVRLATHGDQEQVIVGTVHHPYPGVIIRGFMFAYERTDKTDPQTSVDDIVWLGLNGVILDTHDRAVAALPKDDDDRPLYH
jgi:hypothetical protein